MSDIARHKAGIMKQHCHALSAVGYPYPHPIELSSSHTKTQTQTQTKEEEEGEGVRVRPQKADNDNDNDSDSDSLQGAMATIEKRAAEVGASALFTLPQVLGSSSSRLTTITRITRIRERETPGVGTLGILDVDTLNTDIARAAIMILAGKADVRGRHIDTDIDTDIDIDTDTSDKGGEREKGMKHMRKALCEAYFTESDKLDSDLDLDLDSASVSASVSVKEGEGGGGGGEVGVRRRSRGNAKLDEALQVRPPCRFEVFSFSAVDGRQGPVDVVLDVAHNEDALRALMGKLQQSYLSSSPSPSPSTATSTAIDEDEDEGGDSSIISTGVSERRNDNDNDNRHGNRDRGRNNNRGNVGNVESVQTRDVHVVLGLSSDKALDACCAAILEVVDVRNIHCAQAAHYRAVPVADLQEVLGRLGGVKGVYGGVYDVLAAGGLGECECV